MSGRGRRGGFGSIIPQDNKSMLFKLAIAVLLFLIFYCGQSVRDLSSLEDQKATLEAEVFAKERRLDELQMTLFNKQRDVHRYERRIADLEQKLKQYNNRTRTSNDSSKLKRLFLVTPTYARPTQKAELTRMAQTLMHVANLFWVVVEDAQATSALVKDLLERSKVPYALIAVSTPPDYKLNSTDPNWLKPRGVSQRNAGLTWIRTNIHSSTDGVLYFADDDNTYDLRLFDEMRETQLVSVWPVGLVGGLMVERPVVDQRNIVVDWKVGWKKERPFPTDMAGFALRLSLIYQFPNALFSQEVPRGYQESHLLRQMSVKTEQLEPRADGCTKVYVWHTRTEKAKLKIEDAWRSKGMRSDDGIEV